MNAGEINSQFYAACAAYFKAKLGRQVTNVTFIYDEGYAYSSYTYEDPYFAITVYGPDDEVLAVYHDGETSSKFLTELFAWEDGS